MKPPHLMNAQDLKITLLAENTARGLGIIGEHGLSIWIETNSHRALFDTGQGMALPHNAKQLGIDLSKADSVVLSHGHYDHVGGLEWMLQQAPNAELHMHTRAVERKFSGTSTPSRRVTIPYMEKEKFKSGHRKIIQSSEAHEVIPGVWATGEIPRLNDFEDVGGPFYLDSELNEPDPLLDDQSLFIPTTQGLIVIFGCAHAGVINTLEHIEKLRGGPEKILCLIGGLHLLQASENRMLKTFEGLRKRSPEQMVFCHCTGAEAVCRLSREFPNACQHGHAGMQITF